MSHDPGPFNERQWPDRLPARVVDPGPPRRVHGYALEDLASHYRLAEVLRLTLTGEPPSEDIGRALDVALILWGAISVGEAPAHAALVSRHAAAEPHGSLAVGAVGLVEQARAQVAAHQELLEALAGSVAVPDRYAPTDAADRERAAEIIERLPAPQRDRARARNLGARATLVAILFDCGLRQPWQLVAALVSARLPALAAEVMAAPPGRLIDYPMTLPPYAYEETPDDA